MPTPLCLASTSPTRASMLHAAAVAFTTEPPRVDEEALRAALALQGTTPRDMADALAEMKAVKVSARRPETLVIGADQILSLGSRVFSKPESADDARDQLADLSGKRHELHTAAVIAQAGRPVWRHVDTARLTMRDLSPAYIDAYIGRNWPDVAGSVGAYRIEAEGVRLMARIEGDWFGILGMPLVAILGYLATRGEIET